MIATHRSTRYPTVTNHTTIEGLFKFTFSKIPKDTNIHIQYSDEYIKNNKPASFEFPRRNGGTVTVSFDHHPEVLKAKENENEDVELKIDFLDYTPSEEEFEDDENYYEFFKYFDTLEQ